MVTRIISSIIGLPILIGIVAWGGYPLQLAVLAASLIGMHEFYCAFTGGKGQPVHYVGYTFACIYMLLLEKIINVSNMFNVFVSVFLVVLLVYAVLFHSRVDIKDVVLTFFGFFYVCFLFSHVSLIRNYTYGIYFVWLAFICAWGCDTGAYFTGITIGKHKLTPQLSPKKTIEGSIGGIVVAILIALIYGLAIDKAFPLPMVNTVLLCVVTAAIGSVLSQIGDLAASAMKRHTGIKDFGTLIPGHGGIIDRFDSVLLTGPVVYYVMLFLISVQ